MRDVQYPHSDLWITQASLADVLDLLDAQGRLTVPAREYGQLIVQMSASVAWVARDGNGRVLCVFGVAPVADADAEIWFDVVPDGMGRRLLSLVRMMRLILSAIDEACLVKGDVFATVLDGHRPGERLAVLLGCERTDDFVCGHRKWRWVKGLT